MVDLSYEKVMALPVEDILFQLQSGTEMDEVGEEGDGDEGVGDEEEGDEEEELEGQDLEDVHLEIIDGPKGAKWLIIDQVHICFKHKEKDFGDVYWRCSGARRMGCKFWITTTKPPEDDAAMLSWFKDNVENSKFGGGAPYLPCT